jgi:hypothetical protein
VPGAHLHGRRRAAHIEAAAQTSARYVVTAIDQFSKCSRVGCIRHKSDAAQFVRETILLWEKQTGVCASAQRWVGSTSTLWMGGTR